MVARGWPTNIISISNENGMKIRALNAAMRCGPQNERTAIQTGGTTNKIEFERRNQCARSIAYPNDNTIMNNNNNKSNKRMMLSTDDENEKVNKAKLRFGFVADSMWNINTPQDEFVYVYNIVQSFAFPYILLSGSCWALAFALHRKKSESSHIAAAVELAY